MKLVSQEAQSLPVAKQQQGSDREANSFKMQVCTPSMDCPCHHPMHRQDAPASDAEPLHPFRTLVAEDFGW
ncbi:MAG: hypothetical protein AAFV25_21770 [Bacteroidota bacterium]